MELTGSLQSGKGGGAGERKQVKQCQEIHASIRRRTLTMGQKPDTTLNSF
jgi:hypothetical protein